MNDGTRTIPQPDRPHIPGYGVPETQDGMLPWEWAVERLTSATHVWIATTRPDGRPHAAPVWAVWIDGAIVFESGPNSRRARNIAVNPAVVAHVESGDDIVIVEGLAEAIGRPEPGFESRLIEAFRDPRGYVRIVNVHPSLLPSFPGVDAYRQAFEFGAKSTGVTVHLVELAVDSGPICAQESFSIADCRSVDEVEKRGLAIEHRLFPQTLSWVLAEKFDFAGGSVRARTS